MEGIQVSIQRVGTHNDISLIKVGGYIDTTTSSELEHALSKLLKEGSYKIIIDLNNVDYVSSAGWGIFISEIKGIREHGGDLKLVGMIPEVWEVFELLEFHNILKAFDSVKDAVSDFEKRQPQKAAAGQETTMASESSAGSSEKSSEPAPVEVNDESLDEKIRQIVAENPDVSTTQIARLLNSSEYGNIKIGWIKLRKRLKKLGLNTKSSRYKHARQY